ncbi:MAG: Ltp family lipoprotein [Lachnospiraceae bacterium]|nr:Ltp family lipoprotein [Lachnospiraceae bacterium]
MKKKVIAMMMCGAIALSLAACGSSGNSSDTETESETGEDSTLSKEEYIKLAKETGYRSAINLTYLTQFANNEIVYAAFAETMSDEIADSAFEAMEEYFGLSKAALVLQSGDIIEAYGSYLMNIPDDEEAQEWYDAVAPLCRADMSLYSATCSNLDNYDSSSEFSNTVSELTEDLNDLINDFYHFESAHPVAGTDFHAGYYFSYPEEWWTKTSEDGTYYYIYPEENTTDGFIMIFYEEMGYGDPLTNVTMAGLSIENSSPVVDVESDTGTSVSGFEATEVIYTQMQNDTEYSTDAYVIAQGNEGVVCVSLIVPKDSAADYSEGFNEVLNSITYTGIEFNNSDNTAALEEEEVAEAVDEETEEEAEETEEETEEEVKEIEADEADEPEVTTGERNALQSAKNYLNTMAFSYSGLIEQLEYEGYTEEEATYAADNCGADWNEQAALKAQDYIDIMTFSKDGLISQLEYDGFTGDQAEYGASSVLD